MGRNRGSINQTNNYELTLNAPVDARMMTGLISDLTSLPSRYNGMIVSVTDETDTTLNGLYICKQNLGASSDDWEKVGASGGDIYFPSVSVSTAIQSVGGFSGSLLASDVSGKTFTQLFDTLLFPTQYPTKTDPSISMSGVSNNSVVEFGSTKSYTLTFTANPGKITLSGVDQQYDSSDQTVTSGGVVRYTGAISSVIVNDFDGGDNSFTQSDSGGTETYSGYSTVGNFVITNYDFDNTDDATDGVEVKVKIKWNVGPGAVDSTGATYAGGGIPWAGTAEKTAQATVYPAYFNYQGTSTAGGYEKMKKNAGATMSLKKHKDLQYMPHNVTNLSQFIFQDYTHTTAAPHRFYISEILYTYWTSTKSKSLQVYSPNGDGTGWAAENMANFSISDSTTDVTITETGPGSVTYKLIKYTPDDGTGPKKYKLVFA